MKQITEFIDDSVQLPPSESYIANSNATSAELVIQNLFDQTHDGIAIVQGTDILYANPQLAKLVGYSVDDLCGMSVVYDLSPPKEQAKHLHRVQQRQVGNPMAPRFETFMLCRDGSEIAVEVTTSAMHFQGAQAVLCVVRNITDRQQAQAELTHALYATEKYAHALSLLNQMSQSLNEARSEDEVLDTVSQWAAKIISADRVCVALLTSKPSEVTSESLTVFALDGMIEPVPTGTQLQINDAAVGQPVKTKQIAYSGDNRNSRYPDIQVLCQCGLMSTVSAPLLTAGRVLGTLNICSTQMDAFDPQDRGLVEQMAALIASVLENRRLYEEAKRASETKSLFLSNMTHELRTPMNAVLGMANVLQDTDLSAEQLEYIETILSSGTQLLNVINDVLDFSKIEANKLELELTPFNLQDAIDETLSLFKVTAAAKGLQLTYIIDDDVPKWIIQDVTRLRQILTNLVTNAIKFTDKGNIELEITTQSLGGCQYQLQMALTDTGVGIPQHRIGRLFQSFTQVDASTTRKYGGSGLGLSISKQLCELMGGEMWVVSQPSVGSTFTFTFIAEQTYCRRHLIKASAMGKEQAADTPFNRAMAQTHPLKILLAEDNAVNQKVALSILDRFGYKADVAANGIEVLAALDRQQYDVVLMDVHMPEMDGVEATKRIRSHIQPVQQPAIIAVTANAMEQHREEYLAAGMDDYISKPISIPELVSALENVSGPESTLSTGRQLNLHQNLAKELG